MGVKKVYPFAVENEEGKKFYYLDYGYETHGKKSFRLWIAPHCLRQDKDGYYLELKADKVIENCKLKKTEKGNWVLIPAIGWWTVDILISCGYRGDGWIEEFLYPEEKELIIATYKIYHSPRGSLGIDYGYLISVPPAYDHIKYIWRRSGRTYGAPKRGCEIVFRNGEKREVNGICEDEELKKILEGEL